MMLHTSLRLLRDAGACKARYRVFREAVVAARFGDRDSVPLTVLLPSNDLDDTLWALRAVRPEEVAERDKIARLVACDYAEHVAHLWVPPPGVTWVPADTIAVARRHANGDATDEELAVARDTAWAVARAAAWNVACVVAWDAACVSPRDAARDAARDAVEAAWPDAWEAERAWQMDCLAAHLEARA